MEEMYGQQIYNEETKQQYVKYRLALSDVERKQLILGHSPRQYVDTFYDTSDFSFRDKGVYIRKRSGDDNKVVQMSPHLHYYVESVLPELPEEVVAFLSYTFKRIEVNINGLKMYIDEIIHPVPYEVTTVIGTNWPFKSACYPTFSKFMFSLQTSEYYKKYDDDNSAVTAAVDSIYHESQEVLDKYQKFVWAAETVSGFRNALDNQKGTIEELHLFFNEEWKELQSESKFGSRLCDVQDFMM